MNDKQSVYPYDFMKGPHKKKKIQLPFADQFYSRLNNEHISVADYAQAKHVLTRFNCQTLQDYRDVYWKRDVV